MAKEIITEDYLVALKFVVDGWKIERFGNDFVGVYWKLTNETRHIPGDSPKESEV